MPSSSRAPGTARPDSDVDLQIIAPDVWLAEHDRKRLEAAGARVDDHRSLEPFSSFALQFRCSADPEPMDLDRARWLRRAEALLDHGALILGTGDGRVDGGKPGIRLGALTTDGSMGGLPQNRRIPLRSDA